MYLGYCCIYLLILLTGLQTSFCFHKRLSAPEPGPKLKEGPTEFLKEVPLHTSLLKDKLILRSFSTYSTAENSHHYSLQITNKRLVLELRKGKQKVCKREFTLAPKERSSLELAVQGLGYCQKKSNIMEMIHDAPKNIIEVHRGSQKDIYQRYKILDGSLPYLCKGLAELYPLLAKILKSQDLSACPDYSILF